MDKLIGDYNKYVSLQTTTTKKKKVNRITWILEWMLEITKIYIFSFFCVLISNNPLIIRNFFKLTLLHSLRTHSHVLSYLIPTVTIKYFISLLLLRNKPSQNLSDIKQYNLPLLMSWGHLLHSLAEFSGVHSAFCNQLQVT